MVYQEIFEKIKGKINDLYDNKRVENKKILIGISGIPGSGKSTFAVVLNKYFNESNKEYFKSIIVPFDGFHKFQKDLNEEELKFRGRIDTFDLKYFKKKLFELIEEGNSKEILFPSFQHELKDRLENDIKIHPNHNIIIIEGLYLFVNQLNVDKSFDIKIFLESETQIAMERVAIRNYNAGISNTLEESIKRVNFNDRINAEFVLENSNFENTFFFNNIF